MNGIKRLCEKAFKYERVHDRSVKYFTINATEIDSNVGYLFMGKKSERRSTRIAKNSSKPNNVYSISPGNEGKLKKVIGSLDRKCDNFLRFKNMPLVAVILIIVSLAYTGHLYIENIKLKQDVKYLEEKVDLLLNISSDTNRISSDTNRMLGDIGAAIIGINFPNTELRNIFFIENFNMTYDDAVDYLHLNSNANHEAMAFSNLLNGDYSTSLYLFDLSLIKDKSNVNSKIGKSVALINLNRTLEARDVLLPIVDSTNEKTLNGTIRNAFVNKLIGDSYLREEDFANSSKHYISAIKGYYENTSAYQPIEPLMIAVDIFEMKDDKVIENENIIVRSYDGNWKTGILLTDEGWYLRLSYMITPDYVYIDNVSRQYSKSISKSLFPPKIELGSYTFRTSTTNFSDNSVVSSASIP
ncbi:MAG: hypothetical protein Q8J68_08860 [Methanolobus sp.]|uniref:hypothetical protein n=1 Tax=Methanolobus sp. TaxID=1874737 RepID=UPI002730B692|nr:hypothetical protein [Methanolobus sp.]MDP2217382.1 hypothetical protein [Methanolobus sp.]